MSLRHALTALIDSDSIYVAGYFEENKVDRIAVGDRARVHVLGTRPSLMGRVARIAGIEDRERSEASGGLANVNPTFPWIHLPQRNPVRIDLDDNQQKDALIAGRSASIEIISPTEPPGQH
jgi:multidrug resistance efflux pump